MIIDTISDFHLEFNGEDEHQKQKIIDLFPKESLKGQESFFITSGDNILIKDLHHSTDKYRWFFDLICNKYDYVLYVCGNHEYYNYEYASNSGIQNHPIEFFSSYSHLKYPNLHILENSIFKYKNFVFYGGTMWSNISKDAIKGINDFNMISKHILGTRKNYLLKHDEFKSKLIHNLNDIDNQNKKFIVISHHSPSYKSLHENFKNSKINSAFISDCEYLMDDNVELWVHGHTHKYFDYHIDKTRIICNPYGYPNENEGQQLKRVDYGRN